MDPQSTKCDPSETIFLPDKINVEFDIFRKRNLLQVCVAGLVLAFFGLIVKRNITVALGVLTAAINFFYYTQIVTYYVLDQKLKQIIFYFKIMGMGNDTEIIPFSSVVLLSINSVRHSRFSVAYGDRDSAVLCSHNSVHMLLNSGKFVQIYKGVKSFTYAQKLGEKLATLMDCKFVPGKEFHYMKARKNKTSHQWEIFHKAVVSFLDDI